MTRVLFSPRSTTTCRKTTRPPSNTITPGPSRKTAPLTWIRGRAARMQVERDWSHAFNGSLVSLLPGNAINEFRFQLAREDRPRPYDGPINPTTVRPFPDTAMDFAGAYRFGMPFFIPVDYRDSRIQLLNNISVGMGDHLIKAGVEWNRVASTQTFIGFANGRYIFGLGRRLPQFCGTRQRLCRVRRRQYEHRGGRVQMASRSPAPSCSICNKAGVGGLTVEEAGTQAIPQHELAAFVQDSWRVSDELTLNYGLRWEAQIQAGCAHRSHRSLLRRFHRQNSEQRDGDVHLPVQWQNPLGLDDVPTPPWHGLRHPRGQQDPVARQRWHLPRAHPGLELGRHALDQWLARADHFPIQRARAGFGPAPCVRRLVARARGRSLSPGHHGR